VIIRLMRISSKSGLRSRKILFSAYSGFTLSLYLGFFLPGFTTCAPEPEGSATDAGGASEGFGEGKPAVDGANQANSKGGLPAVKLIRVADGDTLTVRMEGESLRVRMHGVDAPELDQPYGKEARTCLDGLLKNRAIRLRIEYRDPYDRAVSTLIDESGSDLNAILVERGCAWAFVRYSREYVPQERKARSSRSGLWAQEDPLPPWKWRRR